MRKLKILNYFLMLIFFVNLSYAATVYGTVYDLSLKKLDNAVVEMNTSPKQQMVTKNGTYSFDVSNGMYTIEAQLIQKNTVIASAQENITIKQPGNYALDLILFPDIEEGVEEINVDVNGDIIESGVSNSILIIIAILILIIV